MAKSGSSDFDLLWYLDKLNKREFQSLKNLLGQECLAMGLPPIPRSDLKTARPDLARLLTTSYEAQHAWNLLSGILHQIQRKDLCDKIHARRHRNKEMHRVLITEKFLPRWERGLCRNIHNTFCKDVLLEVLDKLDFAFKPVSTGSPKVLNVFLVGQRASGKTEVVSMAVLEWLRGKIWKNIFSYIVPVTAQEINRMADSSLVELVTKDWPGGQAPVADILSEPQKVLFILEDLDNVEANLNVNESALCADSRQQVPVAVLLVSLLRRKMAPGCVVLISSRLEPGAATWAVLKKTDVLVTLPFSKEMRHKYFTLFFRDSQRARVAWELVQENDILTDLCQVPILCWVMCVALGWQMDRGDDLRGPCQTLTGVYAHFLAGALTSKAASQCPRILLECLCSLASKGLLHDTLHFTEEDLRSVGFAPADVSMLQNLKVLSPSSDQKDCYTFSHLKIQEFCMAMAYMMTSTGLPLPSARDRRKEKRERYHDVGPIVASIFGLLNKKTRNVLERAFGCHFQMGEIREYLLQKMKGLGSDPKAMGHHTPLFHCLFENQEDEFVEQIMDSFLEAAIYIQSNKDLMASAYCLGRCRPLRRLKLSVQSIFENKKPPTTLTSCKMKSLVYWRDICSLLHTKENLRELEICHSDLDGTSERVLCKALRHPNCQLQTLKLTYLSVGTAFKDVLKAIVHNQNLTFLSLSCMPISLKMFSLLHEVLGSPMCSIQHLSLMKCDLKANAYEQIASLLICGKKLKKLTLSKNPLSHGGMKILCDALLHPDCTLESLALLFCGLTKTSCSYLARTLLSTDRLKHLDLSVNYLQNHGVSVLTLPLTIPSCALQELELSGCFFTSGVCQNIAYVLESNPNLRSLELGSNGIGDAGMEPLCKALRHRNCKLENIGLEECRLTSLCCASLALVLVSSKTLKKLNLLGNKLGAEGIVQLLEGLGHPDCVLQTVGLQINDMDAEIVKLLMTVKQKNPKLDFTDQSWAKKEGRELSSKLGDLTLSRSVLLGPDLTWHLLSFHKSRSADACSPQTTVSE
ncbi:NACHT, LRR and PYD domains-containing protein 11 [Saccopteryx leptura]|uniref:NACHT, LRR and PYD domains-containing protein 11 n=1 Tax=Saccopteryx leptura TaxID=249018 RepID=UPI00339CF809